MREKMKRSSSSGAEGSVNFELPVLLHVSKSFPFLKGGGNKGRQALQSARTSPTLGTHNLAATRQGGREPGGEGNKYLHFQYEILIWFLCSPTKQRELSRQSRTGNWRCNSSTMDSTGNLQGAPNVGQKQSTKLWSKLLMQNENSFKIWENSPVRKNRIREILGNAWVHLTSKSAL